MDNFRPALLSSDEENRIFLPAGRYANDSAGTGAPTGCLRRTHSCDSEEWMSKIPDTKKETKKKPEKTLKEKRAEKAAKKASKG